MSYVQIAIQEPLVFFLRQTEEDLTTEANISKNPTTQRILICF